MKIDNEIEVVIESVDQRGNGIARYNGIVIFVKNALKDEKCLIRISKVSKRFCEAKIIKLLSENKDRCNAKCEYYEKCGGCSFLHTSYDNEIEAKINYLNRLFNTNVEYIYNKNILNYRNKVSLHVLEGKIGYFNSESHDLCEIDHCELLNPKINLKIAEIKKFNLFGIEEIIIRCINDQIMIKFIGSNINNDILDIEVDSLYFNDKCVKGKEYLIEEINEFKLSIYPDSFFQVNLEGMRLIYDKAKEYIGTGDKLLDLYCGTGTIGIWMHDNFKSVYGCEINPFSIKNANINLELNDIHNIKFECNDAKNIKGKFDGIIVDPPRAGLSDDVIGYLDNSNAKKIVYISCNPSSLKLNLDKFNNYKLEKISACSMFPRTSHVESVVVLERR